MGVNGLLMVPYIPSGRTEVSALPLFLDTQEMFPSPMAITNPGRWAGSRRGLGHLGEAGKAAGGSPWALPLMQGL